MIDRETTIAVFESLLIDPVDPQKKFTNLRFGSVIEISISLNFSDHYITKRNERSILLFPTTEKKRFSTIYASRDRFHSHNVLDC
jgi:hypothetical protein